MIRSRLVIIALSSAAAGLLCVGCHDDGKPDNDKHGSMASGSMKQGADVMSDRRAMATLKPADNQLSDPVNSRIKGSVKVTEIADRVEYAIMIEGLAPNSVHGFHVHEYGNLSAPDLSSAGEHWDTTQAGGPHPHGAAMDMNSHAGDLGNVTADGSGKVNVVVSKKGYKVADVIGKALILHANADDLTSQPAGNSGGRIAGAIIRPQ